MKYTPLFAGHTATGSGLARCTGSLLWSGLRLSRCAARSGVDSCRQTRLVAEVVCLVRPLQVLTRVTATGPSLTKARALQRDKGVDTQQCSNEVQWVNACQGPMQQAETFNTTVCCV